MASNKMMLLVGLQFLMMCVVVHADAVKGREGVAVDRRAGLLPSVVSGLGSGVTSILGGVTTSINPLLHGLSGGVGTVVHSLTGGVGSTLGSVLGGSRSRSGDVVAYPIYYRQPYQPLQVYRPSTYRTSTNLLSHYGSPINLPPTNLPSTNLPLTNLPSTNLPLTNLPSNILPSPYGSQTYRYTYSYPIGAVYSNGNYPTYSRSSYSSYYYPE